MELNENDETKTRNKNAEEFSAVRSVSSGYIHFLFCHRFVANAFLPFFFLFGFTNLYAANDFPIPEIPWIEPDSPARCIYFPTGQDSVLLGVLPALLTNGNAVGYVKASQDSRQLSTRIECISDSEIFFTANGISGNTPVIAYAFRDAESNSMSQPLQATSGAFFVTGRTLKGRELPLTWDEYVIISEQSNEVFLRQRFNDYTTVTDVVSDRLRDKWKNISIAYSTWIKADKSGEFKFRVSANGSIILSINDVSLPKIDSAAIAKHQFEFFPITLQKGLHKVVFVNSVNASELTTLKVEWIPPQASEFTPISQESLVAGPETQVRRLYEDISGVVHPSIAVSVSPPFEVIGGGTSNVCSSVGLLSAGTDWIETKVSSIWRITDTKNSATETFTGDYLDTVLPIGNYKIELEVKDSLGFSATTVREIIVPSSPKAKYFVEGRIMNLPAIVTEDESVTPELWLTGEMPPNTPLDAEVCISFINGEKKAFVKKVFLNTWGRVQTDKFVSKDISTIDWKISLAGRIVDSTQIRFIRRPFDTAPVEAKGAALYAAKPNESLVLIVNPKTSTDANSQSSIPTRIICVDDSIAPPGLRAVSDVNSYTSYLKGCGFTNILVNHLTSKECLGSENLSSLTHLTRLGLKTPQNIGTNDVIILSTGLEDYIIGESADKFEKKLAAICALYKDITGASIILTTLPPFNGDNSRIRPYCESIARVADSYGLNIADFYTAFSSASNKTELVEEIRVTDKGQKLAAEIISRVIRANSGKSETEIND